MSYTYKFLIYVIVTRAGFEPTLTAPKTVVLPLHHQAKFSSILLPAIRNCILLSPSLAVWVLELSRWRESNSHLQIGSLK